MPEGKSISYVEGEYPELDGLEDGSQVKLMINATIKKGEEGGNSLMFDAVQIETDGVADRELKQMTKQEGAYVGSGQKGNSENF